MLGLISSLIAVTGSDVQARMDADAARGKPLIAHVFVALADNEHQGIVKISNASLGNGQSARTNLYWGALFGVRTYLPKNGWKLVRTTSHPGVLERAIFSRTIRRGDQDVRVYVVADAWDGREIQETIESFLEAASGRSTEMISIGDLAIEAGGAAHVIAYVGHNGLMDFALPETSGLEHAASSSIVLACASKSYFADRLVKVGSHPLLLTTNLMAPEAYTLHAALIAWFSGNESARVHDAAGRAYAEYQKYPVRTGMRLFWSAP